MTQDHYYLPQEHSYMYFLLKPYMDIHVQYVFINTWILPSEFRGILVLFMRDDVYEVICEDKWDPFPLDAKFTLEISQEVAKINVNKLEKCTNRM